MFSRRGRNTAVGMTGASRRTTQSRRMFSNDDALYSHGRSQGCKACTLEDTRNSVKADTLLSAPGAELAQGRSAVGSRLHELAFVEQEGGDTEADIAIVLDDEDALSSAVECGLLIWRIHGRSSLTC